MSALAELFPDEDFRFHLTLKRGEPREFFRRQDPGAILAERARWIAGNPDRYARLLPEGEPLLREFSAMASTWGYEDFSALPNPVRELGARFVPDVLFLSRDGEGAFRLRGGALVFPTGWALDDKIGHPMEFIHGVVPGLNQALASPIQLFLSKLRPGAAFLRDNWGIAATDELNLHPARQLSPPVAPARLERLWLRVEYQILFALPQTGGIVFGIRIALHRLDTLRGTPVVSGLCRALGSMSPEMAAYKRLDGIRDEVIRLFAHP